MSLFSSPISSILKSTIGKVVGLADGVPSTTVFYAPLTHSLIPTKGELLSFARSADTIATILDFEGNVVVVPKEATRFQGARQVENLMEQSEPPVIDLNSTPIGLWSVGTSTDIDANGLVSFTGDSTQEWVKYNGGEDLEAGHSYVFVYTVTLLSGAFTGDVQLRHNNGLTNTGAENTIFDTSLFAIGVPVEMQSPVINCTVDCVPFLRFLNNAAVATTLRVNEWQIEDVTNYEVQEASERVSAGVATGPELFTPYDNLQAADFTDIEGTHVFSNGDLFITKADSSTTYAGVKPAITETLEENLYLITIVIEDWVESGTLAKIGVYAGYTSDFAEFNGNGTHTAVLRSFSGGSTPTVWISAKGENQKTLTATVKSLSIKEVQHGSNVDGLKYFDTRRDSSPIFVNDLKGVLIEDLATNITEHSEDFDNAYWLTTGTNLTQVGNIAGIKAWEMRAAGTADVSHIVSSANSLATITPGVPYTASVFIRKGESKYFWMELTSFSTGIVFCFFDLETGLFSSFTESGAGDSTFESAYLEEVDGGYRAVLSVVADSSLTTAVWVLGFSNVDGVRNQVYATNELMGVATGFQVEQSSAPTSYIKTGDSSVNRGADELPYVFPEKLEPAGVSYSVSCEIYVPVDGVDLESPAGILDFGTADDYFSLRISNLGIVTARTKSSTELQNVSIAAPLLKGRHRIAASYDANTKVTSLSVDGSTPVETESFFLVQEFGTGAKHFFIGSEVGGANIANFPIKNVKIDSKTLTDAELIAASDLTQYWVTESGDNIITESGDTIILE